jgi:ribonuclease HI
MKVVVYYDGGCEPVNPKGVAVFGFVIYVDGEKKGEGKGLAAEPWSNNASNNVGEYTAMIKAFEWLLKNGYAPDELTVKGDSQLSIRQMTGEYQVEAPRLIGLHQRAEELSSKFKKVEFQWIPREENGEADMLSELALKEYWIRYKTEKALEIKSQEIKKLSEGRFDVRGFLVDLEAYTCTCPDYLKTNRNPRLRIKLPCKHIIAVQRIENTPL